MNLGQGEGGGGPLPQQGKRQISQAGRSRSALMIAALTTIISSSYILYLQQVRDKDLMEEMAEEREMAARLQSSRSRSSSNASNTSSTKPPSA